MFLAVLTDHAHAVECTGNMSRYGTQPYVSGSGLLGISWIHIVLFGFAYFFFTKFKDAIDNLFSFKSDKDKQAEEQKITRSKAAVQNVTVNESKLPHNNVYYLTFAKMLYTAMEGAGTDKSKIERIFELTPEEFKKVFKEFGVQQNRMFGLDVGIPGNLVEWLEYELNEIGDGSLLNRLRQHVARSGLWE